MDKRELDRLLVTEEVYLGSDQERTVTGPAAPLPDEILSVPETSMALGHLVVAVSEPRPTDGGVVWDITYRSIFRR